MHKAIRVSRLVSRPSNNSLRCGVIMSRLRTLCGALCALAFFIQLEVLPATAQEVRSRTDRGYDDQFTSMAKARERMPKDDAAEGGFALSPSMRIFTGAALLQGYNSNPDLVSSAQRGAWFYGTDVGAALVARGAQSETVILARGAYYRYDLDDRPDRYDSLGLIDHHARLSEHWRLTLGGFLYRDSIDLDRSDRSAAYVQVARTVESHDLFVRMRTLNRTYLNGIGSTASDGGVFEVDETFSNTRTETAAGIFLAKAQMVSPFFQSGVAHVDFTKQANEAVLDRDARDIWGIAGVRVTLSQQVRLDVGVRSNHRRLDQQSLARFDATGFDGKLVITPGPVTYIEVNVDRTFEEPFAADALFTDRSAIRAYASQGFTEQLKGSVSAGLVKHDQIGANFAYREHYVDGRLGYMVSPRTEVFMQGKTQRVRQEGGASDGDVATNNSVGVGVRVGY
jgi:hypothetical protein